MKCKPQIDHASRDAAACSSARQSWASSSGLQAMPLDAVGMHSDRRY